jgi:site-specific DNA-methyltransferase (adenine-specific)
LSAIPETINEFATRANSGHRHLVCEAGILPAGFSSAGETPACPTGWKPVPLFSLYESNDFSQFVSVTQFDLHRQDCIKGMSQLPNEHVDLVVTSPPYNLGVRYRKFSDRKDRQSYLRWCRKWAAEVGRILKPNGSFFLNIGAAPSNPMLPHEIVIELRDFFVLQNTIHWIKSIAIEETRGQIGHAAPHLNPLPEGEADAKRQVRARVNATTHGHFKPINSKRFLNDCHEYIFHFTIEGSVEIDRLALGVPYQDKSNISRWSHTRGSDLRCRGNTWFIPYETIQSREQERPHPATFPVKLAEWCIKLHGISRVHTMLDPFLGIGNSAVAAQRCGVKKFIGFEIDEAYLAEAKRRLG